MCRDGALSPAICRSSRSSPPGCAVAWAMRSVGARLSHQRLLPPVYAMSWRDKMGVCGYRRGAVAPENCARLGPQIWISRDRRFSGTGKSPIDKTAARELRSNGRRLLRLIVPPRRAGMEPVDGLARWLWRTRPTSGLGCSASASISLQNIGQPAVQRREPLWRSWRRRARRVRERRIDDSKEKDAKSGGYARRGGLTFQRIIAFWVGISGNPGRIPG
jgi:hypothetical protein